MKCATGVPTFEDDVAAHAPLLQPSGGRETRDDYVGGPAHRTASGAGGTGTRPYRCCGDMISRNAFSIPSSHSASRLPHIVHE